MENEIQEGAMRGNIRWNEHASTESRPAAPYPRPQNQRAISELETENAELKKKIKTLQKVIQILFEA